ncbi:glycosyltransferase family 1 protein [Treponema rectale]|uniref:Glycosyltransferase family 1 protein n=1 Tax=Treponema rectale TaxID=744512 RepID=A0A7M1XKH0_9SPIR|nr:glycosyltransferase family 1 protein [Treponema rectale]
MKKIIVANYRYFVTGGPEVYMFKFMENSSSYGYESIPFSVKYSQNEKTAYSKYFIDNRGSDNVYFSGIKKTPKGIYRTLEGAFFNHQAYKKISKLINDEQPSVLYALQVINTISPSVFKAAKKKGLKVVHRISDFNLICPRSDLLRDENVCELCVKGKLKNGICHRCYHGSKMASTIRVKSMEFHRRKKLYDYVDYFVTPTDFTRNKLIEGGFDERKVVKIPTFIDASKIEPNYTDYEYLLFLGRLVPEKGAKYLIEAMKYLNANLNTKAVFTGKFDDLDDYSKAFIRDNNLQERVEFVGFQRGDSLVRLIQHSMAVICPAIWYENMPNTILEAFAYGKPVVASNIGCFSELIRDGYNGILFESKNSKELAEKIENMIVSKSYVSMGQNGRKTVETEFTPEQHFKKLQELFDRED